MNPHPPRQSAPAPTLRESSRVRFVPLAMREDGDEWVVGRVDTGDFIAVPPVAAQLIQLLRNGATIAGAGDTIDNTTGLHIDVRGFIAALIDLDFVAAIDGHSLDIPPPPAPTLAWLTPQRCQWVLSRNTGIAVAVLLSCAIAFLPGRLPNRHDLYWSTNGSTVLLVNSLISWLLVGAHELGHLVVA